MSSDQKPGRPGSGKEPTILERRFVSQGSVIVKENDGGHSAFLIQSGKVRVTVRSGEREVELATMGAGQIFGEMALVIDEPRSASVVAVEDCNLIVITRDTFQKKLEHSDPTIRAIVPMLMKRIVQSNNVLLNRQSNLDDLEETVQAIYQNVHASLPTSQKKSLENTILPQLEGFLKAVKDFKNRYGDGE